MIEKTDRKQNNRLIPLMIYLRPVGFTYSSRQNYQIPSTRGELIQVLDECYDRICGAHIHVIGVGETRWSENYSDYIRQANYLKKRYPQVVVDFDLNPLPHEERMDFILNSAVDFCSLWPIRFSNQFGFDAPEQIHGFCLAVQEAGKRLWLRLTCQNDFSVINKTLIETGVLKKPYYFVMSYSCSSNGAEFNAKSYSQLKTSLPQDALLFVQACGAKAVEATKIAIQHGDHVITGLSEILYLDPKRKVLASNQTLIDQCERIALEFNREIAGPAISRDLLKLGVY